MCKYLQNGKHSTEGFHSLLRCRYWRETKALPIISSLSLGREKRMVLQKLCRKIQPPFKLKGEIDILSANVNWPRGLTFVPASPFVLAHWTIWCRSWAGVLKKLTFWHWANGFAFLVQFWWRSRERADCKPLSREAPVHERFSSRRKRGRKSQEKPPWHGSTHCKKKEL